MKTLQGTRSSCPFWVVLFLVLGYHMADAQSLVIPPLQRDDFVKSHDWWEYHSDPENTGAQIKPKIMNGYLHHILQKPQFFGPGLYDQMNNVGFESAAVDILYGPSDTVFIRVRAKFLTPHQPGSRGFGFWYKEGTPVTIDEQAWFMQQKEESGSPRQARDTWWRADKSNGLRYSAHDSVDLPYSYLSEWHVYKIYRYGNNRIEFYVDDSLAMVTTTALPEEGWDYHHWIDNLVYQDSTTGPDTYEIKVVPKDSNAWTASTNEMVTDYVEIFFGDTLSGFSLTPSGLMKLREYPNEIAPGKPNTLWKSYTFNTDGGRVVIMATAMAEEYDGYDRADSLKMVVDAKDYGYGSKGWDGNVLQGGYKIVKIDTTMPSGSHTLKFYSTTTPVLYDVTVLNSLTGTVLLDSTVNQTAPAGSNNLQWIQIPFTVPEAGQVAIYVAAEADENPGWAYKGPTNSNPNIDDDQDDDLRMVLNGTDYGWKTDSSWYGNRDFGEIKTVLIQELLAAGSHTLTFYANNTPTLYRVIIFSEKGDQTVPVELIAFTAEEKSDGVHLKWVTEAEVENLGFHIYRAEGDSLAPPPKEFFRQITLDLIEGAGNSNQRQEYEYVDRFIQPGTGYWYALEDIDYNGERTRHPPIWMRTNPLIMPHRFRLYQNFPNPFNPATTIPFSLAQPSRVRIEIYNLQGQLVDVAVDDFFPAGYHQVEWNSVREEGQPLPAGIYYYRLVAGNRIETKKMVLVR